MKLLTCDVFTYQHDQSNTMKYGSGACFHRVAIQKGDVTAFHMIDFNLTPIPDNILIIFIHSKSRIVTAIVVDEDDNGKFKGLIQCI